MNGVSDTYCFMFAGGFILYIGVCVGLCGSVWCTQSLNFLNLHHHTIHQSELFVHLNLDFLEITRLRMIH